MSKNYSHNLNLGWKNKSDSTRTLLFNANLGLTNTNEEDLSIAKVYSAGNLINNLESQAQLNREELKGNGAFTYMKRGKGAFRLFTAGATAGFATGLSNNDRLNLTHYLGSTVPLIDDQFRDNTT